MSQGTHLLWFRRDLRLRDNAALAAALRNGHAVIPLFILEEKGHGDWGLGGAARVWLHHSLAKLGENLRDHGLSLILRRGEALGVLRELLRETGGVGVYWNRRYEPAGMRIDANIKKTLRDEGFHAESFSSALLYEPQEVSNAQGKPFQVFTPFWKTARKKPVAEPVETDLRRLRKPEAFPTSEPLSSWKLLPRRDWGGRLMRHWEVGETAACARLKAFLQDAARDYKAKRDFPAEAGTSRLSPYLHWGQIGPRQIWKAVEDAGLREDSGGTVFLREIGWREFAHHVLYHFPETPDRPLRPNFENFPWEKDTMVLRAWQKGRTGYPIVDAGMRQLWEEGWMHNRVRMVVASLLVKHLLHPWREGARWFWDTLVDADLASNTLGWQWSGGCGADAAPYFRVFNPIIQGKKFDPDGDYVRRYVPELQKLPNAVLHAPWEADTATLQKARVKLGETYPYPIIEHKKGRDRALAAFEKVKG